jgi:hypothetical protein
MGNAAVFVGQVFNLRPILIGLPTSVQKPPRRVDNPPQVANLPHISSLRASIDTGVRLWEK